MAGCCHAEQMWGERMKKDIKWLEVKIGNVYLRCDKGDVDSLKEIIEIMSKYVKRLEGAE